MILAGKESVDIWLDRSFLALVDEELRLPLVRPALAMDSTNIIE